jgi:pantetheine-phosphate adenylyltransferase
MKIALLPGSFDPPTMGHLDIIKRAQQACDKLIIAVAENVGKKEPLFTIDERLELLKKITHGLNNIEIIAFSELVVEFAKKNNVNFIVRGLRAFSDFEYEFRMALANRKIGGVETLFLMADANLAHISSTYIKELAHFNRHLKDFVPDEIEPFVFNRLVKEQK